MATTNREFDDEKFLSELNKKTGFNTGRANDVEININYSDFRGIATIEVTVRVELKPQEADEILFAAK